MGESASWSKITCNHGCILKICCLKIYPPVKLKQLLVIFFLNHNNSSLIMQKIDFDIWFRLAHRHLEELYQLLMTCVRFLFTALLLSANSTSFFWKTFNKKKVK